jgi:hypothetical protein
MAYPDDRGEVLVSLQDRAQGPDVSAGHLALGVLIGPDHAVFDVPADAAIPDDARLEVVVSLTGPGRADVIEHIRPTQVLIRSVAESPDARVALVPLAHDSRYGAAKPRLTADELSAALDRTGEIWSALIDLRVVPRVLRDVDPTAALARMAEIEALQRRRLVSQVLGVDPGEIARCPLSNATECGSGGFLLERP